MSDNRSSKGWDGASELGSCACSQVRRTARKLSSLYDQALSGSGLTVTQYSVLVNVARAGGVNRTDLASALGMDRTTLTRTLGPLEKTRLIVNAPSADRRERLLSLSEEGKSKVRESYAMWQDAQQTFAQRLGVEDLTALRRLLASAENAVESILSHGKGDIDQQHRKERRKHDRPERRQNPIQHL
jgi:DNA-binding MarR family transcriptional regulator